MDEDREIDNIVNRLQSLQIEQAALVAQLATRARRNTATAVPGEPPARIIQTDDERGFRIGDKVIIRNPGRLQPSKATVVKIGPSQITVRSRNGVKIPRAPHNLILNNDD